MKKNHIADRDRSFRKLFEEYRKLSSAWRDYPVVELAEPYQQGWRREYVLREDAANRRDADVLFRILEMVNSVQFSPRKDFQVRGRKKNKWKEKEHPLKKLNENQYESLSPQQKAWFNGYIVDKPWGSYKEYVFKSPFYFVHEVLPNMITHQVIPDAEVESRYAEVKAYISNNNLWPRIGRIMGWKDSYESIYKERKQKMLAFMDSTMEEEGFVEEERDGLETLKGPSREFLISGR